MRYFSKEVVESVYSRTACSVQQACNFSKKHNEIWVLEITSGNESSRNTLQNVQNQTYYRVIKHRCNNRDSSITTQNKSCKPFTNYLDNESLRTKEKYEDFRIFKQTGLAGLES